MRKRMRMRRALHISYLAVLVAVAGHSPALAQGQGRAGLSATPLVPDSQFQSATVKASSGADPRGPALSGAHAAARWVSVIVKLEDDSVASYTGGVSGLAATSPRVTGKARLDIDAAPTKRYREHLKAKRDAFEAAARQAIPGASVVHRFDLILGGVSMLVPADQVSHAEPAPRRQGRVSATRCCSFTPSAAPRSSAPPVVWEALGGPGSAGEGVIVGVLDSGVWPEHPSFADPDPSARRTPRRRPRCPAPVSASSAAARTPAPPSPATTS